MTLTKRTILMLALLLPAAGVFAQETATETTTTTSSAAKARAADGATTTAETTDSGERGTTREDATPVPLTSYEVRNQFIETLRRYPSELGRILSLDPTLLSNDAFLTGYPALAEFVTAHPEVRRNPRFFLSEFEPAPRRDNVFDEVLEGLFILTMFSFFGFVLFWLVRTFIEQRRWSWLSRAQSEVHNKILDRFSTSEELMEYIRTPAGTKFLESAPIPLNAEQPPQNAPVSRMLWSIQIGVVVAAAAIGMLVVSARFDAETAQGFFAMGVIAFCIGAGFIGSAVVSLVLSRRLGLWQGSESRANVLDDSSVVK